MHEAARRIEGGLTQNVDRVGAIVGDTIGERAIRLPCRTAALEIVNRVGDAGFIEGSCEHSDIFADTEFATRIANEVYTMLR